MEEQLHLEASIVGHLTLKMDLLLQGLIIASQSQIDAGYEGQVFGLIYNLSDREVTLKLGEPVLRLELVRLAEDSDKPYKGDYKDASLGDALQHPLGSSLEEMRETVTAADERTRNTRWLGAAAALVLPFALAYAGGFFDVRDRTSKLEGQLAPSAQSRTISQLECKIERLEARPTQRKRIKC